MKKLEADPACCRQNLKSFLVLPFQRITRIKLLLEVTGGKGDLIELDCLLMGVVDLCSRPSSSRPRPTPTPPSTSPGPSRPFTRSPVSSLTVRLCKTPEHATVSLSSCHQIVNECEESVHKMKCIEELVSLEMLIDFTAVKVTIGFLP